MRCAVDLDRRIEEHWQAQRGLYGMDSLRDSLKHQKDLDGSEGDSDSDANVIVRTLSD